MSGLLLISAIGFSGYYFKFSSNFLRSFSCLDHLSTSNEHLVSCSLLSCFLLASCIATASYLRRSLRKLVFDLEREFILKSVVLYPADLFDLFDLFERALWPRCLCIDPWETALPTLSLGANYALAICTLN